MADSATAKNRNRRVRQEALREQLANQKHVEKAVDLIGKLEKEADELEPIMVQRLKIALDARFKLINKYLPDTKQVEFSGDPDNPVTIAEVKRTIVDAQSSDS